MGGNNKIELVDINLKKKKFFGVNVREKNVIIYNKFIFSITHEWVVKICKIIWN